MTQISSVKYGKS